MALWQFEVLLVPRRHLPVVVRSAGRRLTDTELDAIDGWRGAPLDSESERLIQSFASPYESWDLETKSWGEEEGDRLDILLKRDEVVEISARLDARHRCEGTFVQGLVALAIHLECMFLTSDLDVLPPLLSELCTAFERSDARRFVNDPYTFLQSGDLDGHRER